MVAAAGLFVCVNAAALNVAQLDSAERHTLDAILRILEPHLDAHKQQGTANLLTWEALYTPLSAGQQAFLDAFRSLRGATLGATSHYFGHMAAVDTLVPLGRQITRRGGLVTPIHPQYLPREVLDAYTRMMDAMAADLGRRLLVESGYRSPAYQLYLFLYYLPTHEYSITETNRFVALPGHSEHGYPDRQAIDFINEEGINGEDNPAEFEALPEYAWLQQRAREFGFILSYPRNNPHNTAFEPWHWHYEHP